MIKRNCTLTNCVSSRIRTAYESVNRIDILYMYLELIRTGNDRKNRKNSKKTAKGKTERERSSRFQRTDCAEICFVLKSVYGFRLGFIDCCYPKSTEAYFMFGVG